MVGRGWVMVGRGWERWLTMGRDLGDSLLVEARPPRVAQCAEEFAYEERVPHHHDVLVRGVAHLAQ